MEINSTFSLGLMVLASASVCLVLILLSVFLGPKKRDNPIKNDSFECGTLGSGGVNQRFGVKFYLVSMMFILFDVEVVFMYPWAVTLSEIGWSSFYGMIPFLVIVEFGLLYVWRRGVLDWL